MKWDKRLDKPITKETIGKALSWRTCAVGEKLGLAKKFRNKPNWKINTYIITNHKKLQKLGIKFYHAVNTYDVSYARKILKQIKNFKEKN